MTRVLAQE